MIPACDVRVLGSFGVTVDGRPVSIDSWRSRRAADLVKLLALEPRHRLHREQAMDALWPDLSKESAANLRKAVHYARRALGDTGAVGSQESMLVLWPKGRLEMELDRFERAAAEALRRGDAQTCADVAALYAGDVLPADRYEPWTADHRTAARQRYKSLLKAVGRWERVLELDPTDERAHRALMQRFSIRPATGCIRPLDRPRAQTVSLFWSWVMWVPPFSGSGRLPVCSPVPSNRNVCIAALSRDSSGESAGRFRTGTVRSLP